MAPRSEPAVAVDLAALLRRPGTRREVTVDLTPDEVETSTARVRSVTGTVVVESMGEKVDVMGTVQVAWVGECRRCLGEALGVDDLELLEIYERSGVDGETYDLPDGDVLDLAPMIVEQALLTLPLAPLCRDDCPGPSPDDYPTTVESDADETDDDRPTGDPRWAALDALTFDDD